MRNSNGAIAAPVIVLAVALVLLQASRLTQSSQTNATGTGQQELGEAVKDEPPDALSNPANVPIASPFSNNNHHLPANGHEQFQPHIQLPSKNIQPHASFLTMDKKAHLSGIRIEPVDIGEEGFIGYTEKGVSIVVPNTPVRVVLFGSFLDDIEVIGFTNVDNCMNMTANVHQGDFTIQTERRVVIIYEFEESKTIYKICIRQKVPEYTFISLIMVDDLRCSVSTDMPPRTYYFPFGIQIAIIAALLVLSGLFSGLNLGLMSLTPQELELISKSGSENERKYARTILPVRKSGTQLLCSLLIGNVCVNSAISILFDDLTSGYVALIVSSAGIVVFGEIFPQALCVKKGLAVGARTIWVTRFFIALTFPLAYPISRVLDYILGDEAVSYDRKRLMELMKLTTKNAIGCPPDELKIAIGAFEMGDKTVRDVMTKIDDVFMIPQDTILSAKVVAEILRSGYTRIPVYASASNRDVVSLLFVKDLALLDPDDNFVVKTVCDHYQHPVRRVPEHTPLRTMLEEFKKGDYHMALVVRGTDEDELVGLVTLEDIVEEILQAEIVDETDVVTDNVNRIKRRKNHRHDLDLFTDDSGACLISLQMQLVTIQYLEGNFRAFSFDRIAQNILEKVIRSHTHKVEVSHLTDLNDPKTALPRKAKLYSKEQMSDKFVLILEGRAMVTIGQKEMVFEVGPWHCFGTEILDQLDILIDMVEHQQKSLTSTTGTTSSSTVQAITIRTVNSASSAIDQIDGTSNRISHGALPGINPAAAINVYQQPLVDLIGQDAAKKVKFTPDYSVNILSECTYLEISVPTYLAMYRTTLITRNKEGNDAIPIAPGGIVGGGQTELLNLSSINVPVDSSAIGTPTTATSQHNHQQNVDQNTTETLQQTNDNLVDSTSVTTGIIVCASAEQKSQHSLLIDGTEMLEKLQTVKTTGNGAIVGNRKRMDRHRRTNSDTMTGLLSNGTRLADERSAGEDGEVDLELGHNK